VGLQHRKATPVEGVDGVADGLVGAVQMAGNDGRQLPFGTGEEDLAAADGKGGWGAQPGLQSGSLGRRERAYK
jgi:hypothetical protein